jgi:hypothetical protein
MNMIAGGDVDLSLADDLSIAQYIAAGGNCSGRNLVSARNGLAGRDTACRQDVASFEIAQCDLDIVGGMKANAVLDHSYLSPDPASMPGALPAGLQAMHRSL